MTNAHDGITVTIGIPTYNRRRYVLEAIRSSLGQTYENIEIIVSDNASSDDTWEHISRVPDPRLRCIRQPKNCGMVGNFNAVLNAATGDLFLMLSDDDLLEPDAIEKLSLPFRQNIGDIQSSAIGLVWCPCIIINGAGEDLWQTAAGPAVEASVSLIENLWLGRRGPRLASVLARTVDVRRTGGYDEIRFGALCDTGNWAQVALLYPYIASVQSPLVRYRVHPSSGTGDAVCQEWQQWGKDLVLALVDAARQSGHPDEAGRIERLQEPLLANLTVDVMMRGIGTSGWVGRTLSEAWRSRRYLLTPYVARRIARDGSKLVRQLATKAKGR